MSSEEVTRKVRKGSRAHRLARLAEIRETVANSPVIAEILAQDKPIIITEWK